jgi:hypothetical protein
MEFIVWVETRLAGKTLAVEEVAKFYLLAKWGSILPYRRAAEMLGELGCCSDPDRGRYVVRPQYEPKRGTEYQRWTDH